MFVLGEKTVNQRKHEIVCTHSSRWTDKAVKAFYHTTQWYNQKSLQWDYVAEAVTDKKFVESLK